VTIPFRPTAGNARSTPRGGDLDHGRPALALELVRLYHVRSGALSRVGRQWLSLEREQVFGRDVGSMTASVPLVIAVNWQPC
jgi:hypothetical protein